MHANRGLDSGGSSTLPPGQMTKAIAGKHANKLPNDSDNNAMEIMQCLRFRAAEATYLQADGLPRVRRKLHGAAYRALNRCSS